MIDKKLKLFGINLLHIIKSPDVFKFDILGVRLYSKDVIKQKNAAPTPAPVITPTLDGNTIRLCLREGGGIGDSLFQLIYLKELKKMFKCPISIDFYCRGYKCFQNVPFLNKCMQYVAGQQVSGYDIVITSRRLWEIQIRDTEKIQALAPEFYDFYCKNKQMITDNFAENWTDAIVSHYASLFNKNRIEQSNIHDWLPVNRHTRKYLNWDDSAFGILEVNGLEPGKYITICRAVDAKYSEKHPKLWPLEYYNELIQKIKSKYKDIKIVQVGSDTSYGIFDGVDVCLNGQTTLEQAKVLLKYSLLHIDGEGGLVHMKRFLNGISVVLFGPTSPAIYGYEENINLHQKICPVSCCQISRQWAKECMKEHISPAPCMKCLTPSLVFSAVDKYLHNVSHYTYKVEENVKQLSKSQFAKKSVAVFGRPDEALTDLLSNTSDTFVFTENLNASDTENSNDCGYLNKVRENGWDADYATPYNVPAHDNTYDIVVIAYDKVQHINYVVLEALRVVKTGGKVICKPNFDINIPNVNITASANTEFTIITKK